MSEASRCKLVLLALAAGLASPLAAAEQNHKAWMNYGGGPDSSHFVALDQINKSNVAQLRVAWSYPTEETNSYLFNPIVIDNVMYLLARHSSLVALNAASGKEIWIHEKLSGITTRGISYWESHDRSDRRLIFTINNYLEEIDARTGKSILSFGNHGLVDLREGLSRDPRTITRIQSDTPGRVFENLIMLGSSTGEAYLSPPGDLRAYNVITGKIVWTFHTIPHPGEFGYDTWPKDAWKYSGGTNTWGEISLDERRGIAYFPTGSPTYDYYGADRIGTNLFANCLLALDARTGKRLWHFQMVHHDLWDYDATAAPQLLTVRHDGKLVDAVAQSSKQGFLYVFDRVTGKPLWPIEEKPVPRSDMPGEQAWPTQPFPTAPPPFARQKITPDDVDPYILTAEERARWKDRIASMRNEGLFTPPGLKESISLPGARGGSNWGTGASDPGKGLMFLTSQDWPTVYKLSLEDPLGKPSVGGRNAAALYETSCRECHGEASSVRSAAEPPLLAGIGKRLDLNSFSRTVRGGRGEMPAFSDLDEGDVKKLYDYLSGMEPASSRTTETLPLADLIVGAGGAPGTFDRPESDANHYSPLGGPPYPPGTKGPRDRYYTNWGLYPDQPYVIGPPWSSVVAYDLNRGTIKWKIPLGEDAEAVKQGAPPDAGAFGAEHHGMIVTATGLIFIAASDGKLRAVDEENGRVLWTATLPAGSEGIPAMYEVNGRQYLVICATSKINSGGGHPHSEGASPTQIPDRMQSDTPRAYIAFALPQR